MVSVSSIARFDLIVGSIATLGLLYLLYAEAMVVQYRRFFRLITVGLLSYAVTGPVIGTFAPAFVHAVHGVAVLFITLGLYDLVREDFRPDEDFERILAADTEWESASPDGPAVGTEDD